MWGVGGRGAGAREKRGREGYGRREKKGRQAREKFKNASFGYLLLLTSSQRNQPNNVFRLLFIVLRGLKQNFIGEKSQKTKIRKKKKKTAILRVKLETFPSRLHHKLMNEMAWHMYGCVDCVSRVSVSSVSLAFEILRKNDKSSQVKCRQRPFWSISVFFGVAGKNPSMEDLTRARSVRL